MKMQPCRATKIAICILLRIESLQQWKRGAMLENFQGKGTVYNTIHVYCDNTIHVYCISTVHVYGQLYNVYQVRMACGHSVQAHTCCIRINKCCSYIYIYIYTVTYTGILIFSPHDSLNVLCGLLWGCTLHCMVFETQYGSSYASAKLYTCPFVSLDLQTKL